MSLEYYFFEWQFYVLVASATWHKIYLMQVWKAYFSNSNVLFKVACDPESFWVAQVIMSVEATLSHSGSKDIDVCAPSLGHCMCDQWTRKSGLTWSFWFTILEDLGLWRGRRASFPCQTWWHPAFFRGTWQWPQILRGVSWDFLWDSLDGPLCGRC